MIFINRSIKPVPASIAKPGGKAAKEKADAIKHFTAPQQDKPFSFDAYRSDDIKDTLKAIFLGKCAYCESPILTVTDGDIEHFRPKGEIVTPEKKVIKPGYYWLAADWDNLLLSCNNCNRKTTQAVFGGESFVMGKGNQFPVADESKRCLTHDGDLPAEEAVRLLINPCIDNPEDFFEYLDNGAIRARIHPQPHNIKKAEESIKVFGLLRDPLVNDRKKVIGDIKFIIAGMLEVKEDLADARANADTAKADKLLKRLDRHTSRLQLFLQPDQPYCAVARQMIEPILRENNLL